MTDIKTVVSKLNAAALGGAKIPHCVSNPVIRTDGEGSYIAAFIYTYGKENLQSNTMPRPIHWMIADIETGDVIKEYDCHEKDFSLARFDESFNLNDPLVKRPTRDDFARYYSMFDSLREAYLFGKDVSQLEKEYMKCILEITPCSYRRFYKELSNKD